MCLSVPSISAQIDHVEAKVRHRLSPARDLRAGALHAPVRLNFLINYTNSRQSVRLAPTPATGLTVTLTPNMRNLIQLGADGVNNTADDHDDLWAALMSRPTPYAPFTMTRRTNELGTRDALSENNAFYFLTRIASATRYNWRHAGADLSCH